jgi:hypothetical protein
MTVVNATKLPTERSIPAVMMTRVIPMDANPTMALWRAMVSKFLNVKKLSGTWSENSPKTNSHTKTKTHGPSRAENFIRWMPPA